jgi:putative ABC transport system permease protein
MYRPHTQFRFGDADAPAVPTMTWAIRADGDPSAAISFARAAVRRVDPDLGISDVETMDQVVDDATSDRRLNLLLFALLGSLALVLAAVGVYGVVAYSVAQRTHEIGVRMAIGARPADVRRMVLADGGRLALVGVAIGTVLALVAARVLRGLLFHVSASDPATFVAVGGALIVVATLASYIPARRATRVDPMVALRN